jgi:predicted GIY-YIG superfamily endonuclease
VYVGCTAHDPEVRLKQHLEGYKSARLARRFGLELTPRLYRRRNPMANKEADAFEKELARRLRKKGYAVWQN